MDREGILNALLGVVTAAPCRVPFTGDLTDGQVAIINPSDTSQLIVGMPISGQGVAEDAVIASILPTLTMSKAATTTLAGAQLVQGFATIGVNADGSRQRMRFWEETAEQPAIFVDDGDEFWPTEYQTKPPKVILEASLWIYAKVVDPNATPASQMNALLGAVDLALAPRPVWTGRAVMNVQTLGRSDVEGCWRAGRWRKYSGHLEGQAAAECIVRILIAGDQDSVVTVPIPGPAIPPPAPGMTSLASILPQTADFTIGAANSGSYYTNPAAAGAITGTLPTPAPGLIYAFVVKSPHDLAIASSGPPINYNGNSITRIDSSVVGATLVIVAVDGTGWEVVAATGAWNF